MKLTQMFTLDFFIGVLCAVGVVGIIKEIGWRVLTRFYLRKYGKRCVTVSSNKYETFIMALSGVLAQGGYVAMKGESVMGDYRVVVILNEDAVTW